MQTDKLLCPEIDLLVQEGIKVEIEEITIIETIIGLITEIDQEADGIIIGQVIGETIIRLTIGKVILDQITGKMLNGHLETEAKVDVELQITVMTIQQVEVEIDMITGPFSQDKVHCLMEEMSPDPDLILE